LAAWGASNAVLPYGAEANAALHARVIAPLAPAANRRTPAGTVTPMAISGVADLTGRVLAGRYRLLAPIGAGASGRVYVADDVRLRRRVGVKVLHLALAEDAGFLRRFRAEAQVAASLNHPNVMAVYDWGEDDVPFMVLELLTGGSLRGLLDAGARLSPSQATHVGRQVASALEYAHARGVVHRDIKPANLLFDEHGIARVADFGLARALAEASWTEPAGTVVGTARYAAPEQATGAPLDGRADLYSLAVVLVEAVSGTVPAIADTAIGTLAARTHTPLQAPLSLGRLGPVVERAGRPDPNERYPDAATMRAALADAARTLPPPQPLPLAGLGGEIDGGDPTRIGRSSKLFDQDAAASEPEPEIEIVPDAVSGRRSGTPGTHRRVSVVVAVAVLLALVGSAVALASPGAGTMAVPSVVGLTTAAATVQVAAGGLSPKIVAVRADDPKGTVIAQHPGPGSFASGDGSVELVVSRGPPPVVVPDVAGKSVADATAALQQAGFGVGDPVHQYDEVVPAATVIGSQPAKGARVPRDSAVKVVVSDGPAPVTVDDVSKKSFDQAAQVLGGKGFAVTRRDDFSPTVPTGQVIGTDPPAGQAIAKGSSVTIIVSKGPELVAVPDLTGMSLDASTQLLQGKGFVVDTQSYLPGRVVRAQDPAAGKSVLKGTTVTLFF
jgi:beta-lactam-binding protein with PASTA domain/serine/threonine protein kinase